MGYKDYFCLRHHHVFSESWLFPMHAFHCYSLYIMDAQSAAHGTHAEHKVPQRTSTLDTPALQAVPTILKVQVWIRRNYYIYRIWTIAKASKKSEHT